MAFAGVLGSITVVLGLLPVGGFITVPGVSVTTMHIPTILAGIYEGPVIGGLVGAIFGAFSFWKAVTVGQALDRLIFSNVLIALLPRILIGVVSYYVFALAQGKRGEAVLTGATGAVIAYTGYAVAGSLGYEGRLATAVVVGLLAVVLVRAIQRRYGHGPALAAIAGSLVNTVLVLGLSVAFRYIPGVVALTVGVTNGIPEAAVAMVLTSLVYRSTKRFVAEPRAALPRPGDKGR